MMQAFYKKVDALEEYSPREVNSFSNECISKRLPKVAEEVVQYGSSILSSTQKQRLNELGQALRTNGKTCSSSSTSTLWWDLPWYVAEARFFRTVIEIVDYFATGWDPYGYVKEKDWEADSITWSHLESSLKDISCSSDLSLALKHCLWGNKADGNFREVKDTLSTDGLCNTDDLIIVNDTASLVSYLEARQQSPNVKGIQFINDNSGIELLNDLILADLLLTQKLASRVTFNLKVHPTYVSDATVADFKKMMSAMKKHSSSTTISEFYSRISSFLESSAIVLSDHEFWNSDGYFYEMPSSVRQELARNSDLVIVKGDANYRRCLGDRKWDATTPVEVAIPYFPIPFIALRTLKSNGVVGLDDALTHTLDATDTSWRTNGLRGVIQGVLHTTFIMEYEQQLLQLQMIYPTNNNGHSNFAYRTMSKRIPAIALDVSAGNKTGWTAEQIQELQKLHDSLTSDSVIDYSDASIEWTRLWSSESKLQTWLSSPWFFAESYFFYQILVITGYFKNREVDPFAYSKERELSNESTWKNFQSVLTSITNIECSDAAIVRSIKASLWGNKADGCFLANEASSHHTAGDANDAYLLVDHSNKVLEYIRHQLPSSNSQVDFICDNSGTELLVDLCLVDVLLSQNAVSRVVFHLKAFPTYVSDTTVADVGITLKAIMNHNTTIFTDFGRRIQSYLKSGKLKLVDDEFWNSPRFFNDLPLHLHRSFRLESSLVIIKGDANYRRLVCDRIWPTSTSISTAVPYFPQSFVALRTLKSNPIVGLEFAETEDDADWRVNGKRGVIQAVL